MNTQNKTSVWDGVKIGCGIFIVLPAIIGTVLLLIVGVPTCSLIKNASSLKERRESVKKQQIEQMQRKN